MRWRLLQVLIMFLVLAANIHWEWTKNGYLASVWAGLTAIAVTWSIGKALDVRQYGWEATMPSNAAIWGVTWKTVATVVGLFAIMYIGGSIQDAIWPAKPAVAVDAQLSAPQ